MGLVLGLSFVETFVDGGKDGRHADWQSAIQQAGSLRYENWSGGVPKASSPF
jgi:hypothetical protein